MQHTRAREYRPVRIVRSCLQRSLDPVIEGLLRGFNWRAIAALECCATVLRVPMIRPSAAERLLPRRLF